MPIGHVGEDGPVVVRGPRPSPIPPTLRITAPSGPARAGTPVVVSGIAFSGTTFVSDDVTGEWVGVPGEPLTGDVEVTFDTGESGSAAVAGSSWSVPVVLQRPGISTATAALARAGRTAPMPFTVGPAEELTVEITAPADGDTVALPVTGRTLDITVRTTTQARFGGLGVTAVVGPDDRTAVLVPAPEQPDPAITTWRGGIHLDPLPLGARAVVVRATSQWADTVTATSTPVTVTGTDSSPPEFTVDVAEGGKVVAAGSGTQRTIALAGGLADVQSGVAGGQAIVEIGIDPGGPWTPATPTAPADWSRWSATVAVPGLGATTVFLRGSDAAGNTSDPRAWPVDVISGYVPTTLAERLAPTAYLAGLVMFARDVITMTTGVVDPPSIADLARALDQPLELMIEPVGAGARAATRPVNELRVPVERLRVLLDRAGHADVVPGRYLRLVYDALLAAAGTTSAELRLARRAEPEARRALARRLGLSTAETARPDRLDRLTLGPATLTEDALERLFGLPSTDPALAPLRDIPPPAFPAWQRTVQISGWRGEDRDGGGRRFATVVVDPDVITVEDVVLTATPGPRAAALLAERAEVLAEREAVLADVTRPDPVDRFAELLAVGAPTWPAGLLADLAERERRGEDIAATLETAGMSRTGYATLQHVRALAEDGDVTVEEWDAVVAVLVGAHRRSLAASWRDEEDRAGIALLPDLFSGAGPGPEVDARRTDPRARSEWLTTLRARRRRAEAQAEATRRAVADAEQAALPLLRDHLLALAATELGAPAGDDLTDVLQIDVRAAGTVTTTRLAQATAAVQALIELVRSGDVRTPAEAATWTLRIDGSAFETQWRAMGSLAGWTDATTAFLFPEPHLDPTLLGAGAGPEPSEEFRTFLAALRDLPVAADAAAVADLAAGYLTARASQLAGGPPPEDAHYLSGRDAGHQTALLGWSRTVAGTDARAALEAFWAVPTAVAHRLLAAGHHAAALDWSWVVLPYNDPTAPSISSVVEDERNTAPAAPDLTFPPNWTSALDPFALAAGRPAPYLRATLLTTAACLSLLGDEHFTEETDAALGLARSAYRTAARLLEHPSLVAVAPSTPGEATLAIPQIATLARRVRAQLDKLRAGANIAGLPRVVAATGGGTTIRRPTPYYYKVLLARARQLAEQASQVGAQYLSLVERYENATLTEDDAASAATLGRLQAAVHDQRVQSAHEGIASAEAQYDRAVAVDARYGEQLAEPLTAHEQELLGQYGRMRALRNVVSGANAAAEIAQVIGSNLSVTDQVFSGGAKGALAVVAAGGIAVRAGAEMMINDLDASMQAGQLLAGAERRQQELSVARTGSAADVRIADAGRTASLTQLAVSEAERLVAVEQRRQADARLTFLRGRFAQAGLYRWMSETVGSVHRFFLQNATATARLAQDQLAFERVEPPRAFVAADYWNGPAGGGAPAETRGLTGAERLLADLARLDEYAFGTDARRRNISQTFSLASAIPVEFLRFRRTGVLSFTTPAAWFDEAFPGDYQRLIRGVEVRVVGLFNPDRGMRATLGTSGISRVTTPQELGDFAEVVLRRDPEEIAFTSPAGGTGVFVQDLQPELVKPFEGSGVDTTWQFTLHPAANPSVDLTAIADVALRIDYTALASADLRTETVRRLNADRERSSDRVLLLAEDFPEQWYALTNPADPAVARAVDLPLSRTDFPHGIDELVSVHLTVGLTPVDDTPLPPVTLTLTRDTTGAAVAGDAATGPDGVASTRRGAAGWSDLLGVDPATTWRLALDPTGGVLLDAARITDIVIVIGWLGRAPAWPVQ